MSGSDAIVGPRSVLKRGDGDFPAALERLSRPPERLYVIGNAAALQEGIAIVGARRATPYGLSCAKHFGELAARHGIVVISGGARGCDAASHRAALEGGVRTVAFLGGGCDRVYPKENLPLFQEIVDAGGAIVSENPWDFDPQRYAFRERNRLIAGLAKATLIVEAGLPSGTFTTADFAIEAGREVLVVPGSITSAHSRGANRLIYQGATPVIDDETFQDQLQGIFGVEFSKDASDGIQKGFGECSGLERRLLEAIDAERTSLDDLRTMAAEALGGTEALSWVMVWLAKMQAVNRIARYPDGRYGPVVS